MNKLRIRVVLLAVVVALHMLLAVGCGTAGGSLNMTVKTPDPGYGTPIKPELVQPVGPGDGNPDEGNPGEGNVDDGTDPDWMPDIIDRDEAYAPVDDSVRYDYGAGKINMTTAAGSFSATAGSGLHSDYTVTAPYSLAVERTTPFPYGTYSCDVRTVPGADSGIVFGLTASSELFWESGVSYYIFLMSADGNLYLGLIDDGTWSVLNSAKYSFTTEDAYTLKVVYRGRYIFCYINGTKVIEFVDSTPLTGTGFGIRGGGTGAIFSNISVTNDYLY